MPGKKIKLFIPVLAILLLTAAAAVFYALKTEQGGMLLFRKSLAKYAGSEAVESGNGRGSLWDGIVLEKIEITDPRGFPPGTVIKIQVLELQVRALNFEGVRAKVTNGQLRLPSAYPILFYGSLACGKLDCDFSAQNIELADIAPFFSDKTLFRNISARIEKCDIAVTGTVARPRFSGKFTIGSMSYREFSLSKAPLIFDLTIDTTVPNIAWEGKVTLNQGRLAGRRTAQIELEQSSLSFLGNPADPVLSVQGKATVGKTNIDVVVKGTAQVPELRASSDPPRKEQILLVMLATGKEWSETEKALGSGTLSPGVAGDFIDYFVFSGSGKTLARSLGLNELTFTYEEEKKGLEIKKSLNGKVDATYGISQSVDKTGEPSSLTQKAGAEYKVTGTIAVGAEREVTREQEKTSEDEPAQVEDKIYLKYKKDF